MKIKITTVKIDTIVHCGEPVKYAIMIEDNYGTEVHYVSHKISHCMGMDVISHLAMMGAHTGEDCILENMMLTQSGAIVNGEWMDHEQMRPVFESTRSLLPPDTPEFM